MCGGTGHPQDTNQGEAGLSPRVRGNRRRQAGADGRGGSIPACAGEPATSVPACADATVYPRVCGGTRCALGRKPVPAGLSPRVRGNHITYCEPFCGMRSIPACAGEPVTGIDGDVVRAVYPRVCGGTRCPRLSESRTTVYPRVCGGTAHLPERQSEIEGLSPRVRGNHPTPLKLNRSRGSIPACAGEPSTCSGSRSSDRVYPRVCGGTRFAVH